MRRAKVLLVLAIVFGAFLLMVGGGLAYLRYVAEFRFQGPPEDVLEPFGIRLAQVEATIEVAAVDDNSPAEQAGVRAGDYVRAADGKTVTSLEELRRTKAALDLTLARRDGHSYAVSLMRVGTKTLRHNVGLLQTAEGKRAYVQEPLRVGAPLGDWSLMALDGREIFIGNDEHLALVLWSPHCASTRTVVEEYSRRLEANPTNLRVIGLIWAPTSESPRADVDYQSLPFPTVVLPRHSRLATRLGLYADDFGAQFPQVYEFVGGILARVDRRPNV